MKAIGMYIFGGSQTIGHLQTGWEVDRVLEMTNDMDKNNAVHFIRNYPDIPVILPEEWNNEDYINKLSNNNYDLLFANNPCSGLSSINRNAKVDNSINGRFYEVIDMVMKLQPKIFFIENAPTLVNLGLPILKDICNTVNDKYRLLIMNDLAGNHKTPMHRRRTFTIGFNREFFDGVPIINDKKEFTTVKESLEGLSSSSKNMEDDKVKLNKDLVKYYHLVKPDDCLMQTLAIHYNEVKNELDEKTLHEVELIKERYENKASVWDKSPYRLNNEGLAPSMSSVNRFMHPTENRDLYIREYARLMGYPDTFEFYPDDCGVSCIQSIAQGVPVNFIKYISNELMNSFNYEKFNSKYDVIYINQTSKSGDRLVNKFIKDEFINCNNITRKDKVKHKVNLFE